MKKIIIAFVLLGFSFGFTQKNAYDIARSGTLLEIEQLYQTDSLSLNIPNESGYTALILACYRKNMPVAKFLIEKKITLDFGSGMGTALMASTFKGNVAAVKLLIDNDANLNLTDANGQNVLMMAITVKNIEIIKLLLAAKINLEARDNNKKQAIDYALMTNDQTIIKLITKKIASVDNYA